MSLNDCPIVKYCEDECRVLDFRDCNKYQNFKDDFHKMRYSEIYKRLVEDIEDETRWF